MAGSFPKAIFSLVFQQHYKSSHWYQQGIHLLQYLDERSFIRFSTTFVVAPSFNAVLPRPEVHHQLGVL